MAKIKDLADIVASHGRGQDSLLAHINPREAMMLRARGGSGVRNPKTGILEFDDGDSGDYGEGLGDAGLGSGGSAVGNFGGLGSFGGDTSGTPNDFMGPQNDLNASIQGPPNESDFMGAPENTSFESNFAPSDVTPTVAEPSLFSKFTQKFFSMLPGQVAGAVANAAGIPGIVSAPAIGIAKGQSPAEAAFNTFANFATQGVYGLAKGALGAAGVSPDANQAGNTGGNTGQGGAGMDLNGLLQGLGGLYMGHRATGQYNDALGTLNNLYSPNSPYAQNMKQALERRDAAAGRRSQYGSREVELAGNLAQAQGQALSSPGYANLMQQRGIQQNRGLGTILSLLSKGGRGGQGPQGWGLQDLMNKMNGVSNQYDLGPNAGPQMPTDTGGIIDMFNNGGGQQDYTPWESGWGG